MAHIVCMTSGMRGLLNASFEVMARLQGAGHQVSCVSPHPIGDEVRAQGIDYHELPPVNFDPAPPPVLVSGMLAGPRSRLAEWRSAPARRRAGVDALGMSAFSDLLQSQKPDLLLIDSELYEHIFCAYALRVPIALLTPFFGHQYRPGLAPLQSGVVPGSGITGSRVGLKFLWLHTHLQRRFSALHTGLRYAFTERRSVLRQYARDCGFPRQWLNEFDWVTLFALRGLPCLSLTARELEFPHSPAREFHYVGPMVARQRREPSLSASDAARLAGVLEATRDQSRPLVYCGLSTVEAGDDDFAERLIAAMAAHPEWTLVLGAGGRQPGSLPANVEVFSALPQLRVLAAADLCIARGGINTVHECLAEAVPMLAYSQGRFDNPGVTARLAFHGLARVGDTRRDTAAVIARQIAAALGDQQLRERVRQCRESLAHYRNNQVLETRIEQLLAESPLQHRGEAPACAEAGD